jgi:NAD(P)-dependent dehydrogenase (short-subunit alcohol dehydrogenase family)
LVIRTDVSKHADVRAMVAATVDHFGRLDCRVNNAGIAGGGAGTLQPVGRAHRLSIVRRAGGHEFSRIENSRLSKGTASRDARRLLTPPAHSAADTWTTTRA